jgi:hypothetical protein
MFDTTIGMVVPMRSVVARSTSRRDPTADMLGTMKTSLYVRSYGGGVSLRNLMTVWCWVVSTADSG